MPTPADRYCLTCEYNLAHLTTPRCPECGRPFDPDDPYTYHCPANTLPEPWMILLCGYGVLLVLFVRATGPASFQPASGGEQLIDTALWLICLGFAALGRSANRGLARLLFALSLVAITISMLVPMLF